MKITVMGSDYAGLVIGAYSAELGNDVICHDFNTDKIQSLQRCKIAINDLELRRMIARNKGAGKLAFTHDSIQSITHGELIFISVDIAPHDPTQASCNRLSSTVRHIAHWGKGSKICIVNARRNCHTAMHVAALIRATAGQRCLASSDAFAISRLMRCHYAPQEIMC